jgi:hypothetical protein
MANYPTLTYDNLEERFKSIAGLASLETTDAAFLRQAVNRRVRTAFERYPWPDFTVIGEAVAMATGDDNTIQTYGAGKDIANDSNVVFRIHKTDPTDTRYPEEYTYVSTLNVGGFPSVKIISPTILDGISVYATYRKDLGAVIADGGTYTSGSYGDEANDNPNIPYQFFEYCAFGDKAQVEDQNSEIILVSEIDKVRNQSRQFRHDVLQYRPQTQFARHNVQAGGTPLNKPETILNNNVQ